MKQVDPLNLPVVNRETGSTANGGAGTKQSKTVGNVETINENQKVPQPGQPTNKLDPPPFWPIVFLQLLCIAIVVT